MVQTTQIDPATPILERAVEARPASSIAATVAAQKQVGFFFKAGDILLRLASGLTRCLAYLTVALALFAAASAGYAYYYVPDSESFIAQFLQLSLYVLYYLAAPALLLGCLSLLPVEGWRLLWGQDSLCSEKGVHPAVVLVSAMILLGVTWSAHVSLQGDWLSLPQRAMQVLDIH